MVLGNKYTSYLPCFITILLFIHVRVSDSYGYEYSEYERRETYCYIIY